MSSRLVESDMVRQWVRLPQPTDHKYSRGVLGMMTGSAAYPGAALLVANAALRTGVGMARYLGPPEVQHLVVAQHPEVVISTGRVDAYVIGSGMPQSLPTEHAEKVREALASGVPVVLDAGGLAFAEHCAPATVLTPHSGELAELCERLGQGALGGDEDRARSMATQLGVSVLVKGSLTQVIDPEGVQWSLPRATPWLATAGTGDVLAGIIGALVAAHADRVLTNPSSIAQAAAVGAYIHALAATRASRILSQGASQGGPITPSDICEHIPAVIGEIVQG